MTNRRKVAGAIRFVVYVRVFDLTVKGLPVHVLIYGSEKMVWKEKERSRIRSAQKDNVIELLGIRKIEEWRLLSLKNCVVLRKRWMKGLITLFRE